MNLAIGAATMFGQEISVRHYVSSQGVTIFPSRGTTKCTGNGEMATGCIRSDLFIRQHCRHARIAAALVTL